VHPLESRTETLEKFVFSGLGMMTATSEEREVKAAAALAAVGSC
jgi:hypothetical protein